MADDTNNHSFFHPEDAVANGWILDFVCYTTWKEFLTQGKEFNNSRDFLQGLLARSVESTPMRQTRMKLVQLLCRLADGNDSTTRYDEDGDDITPLESALPILDVLVENTEVPDEMVAGVRRLMKLQSVLICCAGDDFDTAEEVFQRVWSPAAGDVQSADVEEKKLCTKLSQLIKSRNPEDNFIKKTHPYERFLQEMTDFLQIIVDGFKEPFLLRAAQSVVRNRMQGVPESETDDSVYETPSEKEGHSEQTEFVFESVDSLQECFMVMAKEEKSGAEWKDVVDYDYSNLHKNIKESQAANTTESTVGRSPRKSEHPAKVTGTAIRKSPRKEMATAMSKETAKATGHTGLAAQGSSIETEQTNRHRTGLTEKPAAQGKRKLRDTDTQENGSLQPSTSSMQANQAKRRVLQHDSSSSESDEDAGKENIGKRAKNRSKKRRDLTGYAAMSDGEKETWSSEDETFSRPVQKRVRAVSESSCSSGDLRPPLPSLPPVRKLPPHLRRKATPPKIDYTTKGKIRRRQPWTDKEVKYLIEGVKKYGIGSWVEIRNNFPFNECRTNVNLKDKWRQLEQSGVDEYP